MVRRECIRAEQFYSVGWGGNVHVVGRQALVFLKIHVAGVVHKLKSLF